MAKAAILTAEQATERAVEFIKKYYPYVLPVGARQEDDFWMADVDVGVLRTIVIRLKLDRHTGDVIEYGPAKE